MLSSRFIVATPLLCLGLGIVVAMMLGRAQAAEDRTQARSVVLTRYGIVATEHPLASQIGAKVLSEGGDAVDAAIAANAALGLMGPMANGLGGDMFAIVYEAKTGKL